MTSSSGGVTLTILTTTSTPTGTRSLRISATGGGQTRTTTVNLTVEAPQCTYSVSPAGRSFEADGGSEEIQVSAGTGCRWTAAVSSGGRDWITLTSETSGRGNGRLAYSVATNSGPTARNGSITITDQTFTVTQRAACPLLVVPTSAWYAAEGGNGSIQVTAGNECRWTASVNVEWITLSGSGSASGTGAVEYLVGVNREGSYRTGTLTIGEKAVTVNQGPADQSGLSRQWCQ